MHRLTVFTPTYNRAATLPRAYSSLLAQTNKSFEWLIIDDGSADNTKEVVDGWIKDGQLSIKYVYKPNGGKYTAMQMANELCTTKYLLTLDSDDELVPAAVQVIQEQWQQIEAGGLENSIAEIRAYSKFTDGKILGNYLLPDKVEYIDATWQEMVLKNKNDNELFCSWNLEKLQSVMNDQEDFWLKGKFKYLGESIYWARLGKKYKSRYLNAALRIYHLDGGSSIIRNSAQQTVFYNTIVGNKYFLDENVDYFFWRPKYFFNMLLKFGICGFILKIGFTQSLKVIHSAKLKLYYVLSYPISLALYLYYSKIKKRYWM